MSDIDIRRTGIAGRITLTRPDALNALTPDMADAIAAALEDWRDEDGVGMVLIDAAPGRAFCAGGDIAMIHAAGLAGDYDGPRAFWRREYRLNLAIADYPKPVAAFLHGFTMGGGVGIGCHASHRIVGESSRIAMPECTIGLIPDVGGSLLLARAPGHAGEYLGTTATRMDAADAIHAGFADYHIPEAAWPDLIARLEQRADWAAIEAAATDPGASTLETMESEINRHFSKQSLRRIVDHLTKAKGDFAAQTLAAMARVSPLSAACTVGLVRHSRAADNLEDALRAEYRFTHRAISNGELIEGIRAQVIDKDRAPHWRHDGPGKVPKEDVAAMLAPLGDDDWRVVE